MNEVDPIPAAVNISLLDSTVILTAVVLPALINPLEAVKMPVILVSPTTVSLEEVGIVVPIPTLTVVPIPTTLL